MNQQAPTTVLGQTKQPEPPKAAPVAKKPQGPFEILSAGLDARRASFAEVLPKHVSVERFLQSIRVAAMKSPAILNCQPDSIFLAAREAARLGLDCSGTLGSGYLVPYGNKCQLIIGYRGLIDLARRSREIVSIAAYVVHAGDDFDVFLGTSPSIVHKPSISDPGEMVAVYMVAELAGGGRQFEVMTKAQVDAVRSRSRASGSGPWVTDYEEMARKTVVRRGMKYLPLSPEVMEQLTSEDDAEAEAKVAMLPPKRDKLRDALNIADLPSDQVSVETSPEDGQ